MAGQLGRAIGQGNEASGRVRDGVRAELGVCVRAPSRLVPKLQTAKRDRSIYLSVHIYIYICVYT